MAISVTAVVPNPSLPPSAGVPSGLRIFSGVVQCVFKGPAGGGVARDQLTFKVGRVNFPGTTTAPAASCVASPASFGHDGPGDALWAVDAARVPRFVEIDSGSGTANLEVVLDLAVRGEDGYILRVNYTVFYLPA